MGKVDPEPPQRTGIILAFNDMNEFEKYVPALVYVLCNTIQYCEIMMVSIGIDCVIQPVV